jgi:hypothetical protein
MEPQEWQQKQQEMRRVFVGQLIERVSQETYPSMTMLDIIEDSMGPEDVEGYAEVLMEKIRQDAYPSFALIDRVRALF